MKQVHIKSVESSTAAKPGVVRAAGTKLLQGAAVLAAAALISKLLGTLQKIPLQNIAGDAAFGIYNAVYPVYILILFLATAGFPITISKFVAERAAQGDFHGAQRIVKVSSLLLTATGLLFFFLLYAGAPQLASSIGFSHAERAIRSVSFALLITPHLAVVRGYFQGYQNMLPTAVSQVMEQLVRVITMIALLLYFVSRDYSLDWIAAGATFGSVTGAAAGLVVMLIYWRRERLAPAYPAASLPPAGDAGVRSRVGHAERLRREPSAFQLMKQIAAYAIPICLGTIAVPLLNLVDTFTMPRLLQLGQLSEAEAMRQFGLYNRGLPLVQLVVMIASSMSVALVPAIAEAKARGDLAAIRQTAGISLKLTWLIGIGASFGLAFAAVPINLMLYKTSEASWVMVILAFTALFSTLNTVTGSILQGFGAVRTPVLCLFVAIVLKALGNVLLMPRWGIEGAALSAVIAFAAAAGLGLVQAVRCTGAGFTLRQYAAGPTLAVGLMGGCLAALQFVAKAAPPSLLPPERWAHSAIALCCVVAGAAVYALTLLRSGSISREDLRLIPGLERRLVPFLDKHKLIPKGEA